MAYGVLFDQYRLYGGTVASSSVAAEHGVTNQTEYGVRSRLRSALYGAIHGGSGTSVVQSKNCQETRLSLMGPRRPPVFSSDSCRTEVVGVRCQVQLAAGKDLDSQNAGTQYQQRNEASDSMAPQPRCKNRTQAQSKMIQTSSRLCSLLSSSILLLTHALVSLRPKRPAWAAWTCSAYPPLLST